MSQSPEDNQNLDVPEQNNQPPLWPEEAIHSQLTSWTLGVSGIVIDTITIKYAPALLRDNPHAMGALALLGGSLTIGSGYYWQQANQILDRFWDTQKD